mgnify:FL=1
MDVMACREVLDNLMEACEILDLDEPDYPKWKELRGKLPTYLLDEEGAVKEWSFKYSGENYDHRHVSHHYDVWPGRAITPEKRRSWFSRLSCPTGSGAIRMIRPMA